MDNEINKNWLEAIKSSIDICNVIIDMQTAEIQDIMFKQEDKVIIEDENGEPTIGIDVDTMIPQLEKLNHNLDVLKDSRVHLLEKVEDLIDEIEEEHEERSW
jgi:predicted transcriptional regulator